MLGSVRHKVFFWDDDIDVYLLRDGYNILLAHGGEFQEPYSLQSFYTDRCDVKAYSRLRNSETTGYTEAETEFEQNKGFFIDISPLDGVSEDSKKDVKQEKPNRWYRKLLKFNLGIISISSFSEKTRKPDNLLNVLIKIFGKDFFFRRIEKNLSRYSFPKQKSGVIGRSTLIARELVGHSTIIAICSCVTLKDSNFLFQPTTMPC